MLGALMLQAKATWTGAQALPFTNAEQRLWLLRVMENKMDIEKLKTDPSLWPEGASFYVACTRGDNKDGRFVKHEPGGLFLFNDAGKWEQGTWSAITCMSSEYEIIDRPTEQKVEELKPRDLACFEQVAKVIGEKHAEFELQKVIDLPIDKTGLSKDEQSISEAFAWGEVYDDSYKFWNTISFGINPYELPEKPTPKSDKEVSDGSTASYYELPEGSKELQDLISHRNMNYAIGSIFSLCYDHSKNAHSSIETAIEIRRMAEFEIKRLEEMQGM